MLPPFLSLIQQATLSRLKEKDMNTKCEVAAESRIPEEQECSQLQSAERHINNLLKENEELRKIIFARADAWEAKHRELLGMWTQRDNLRSDLDAATRLIERLREQLPKTKVDSASRQYILALEAACKSAFGVIANLRVPQTINDAALQIFKSIVDNIKQER
jgi:hypothetical protein